MREDIKILLFDLGGVIVTWRGIEGLLDFSGGKMTLEDSRLFWLHSTWVRKFERGWCGVPEFIEGVRKELGFPVSVDRFREAFESWDQGPMPGAVELLSRLKGHYQLVCLSNNEEIHWNRLRKNFEMDRFFDRCYLSHLIGMVKPDLEVYQYVIRDLGVEARRILFFDDNPECVDAAREAGMRAYVAKGIEGVSTRLEELGILPFPAEG